MIVIYSLMGQKKLICLGVGWGVGGGHWLKKMINFMVSLQTVRGSVADTQPLQVVYNTVVSVDEW